MIAGNFTLIVILALACVYTLISAALIASALYKVTGKELRHLMAALFITVAAGFFYGLSQLMQQLEVIDANRQVAINYISNFVLFAMFVMLIYVSFLTRELGKRFGFKNAVSKIKEKLNSK